MLTLGAEAAFWAAVAARVGGGDRGTDLGVDRGAAAVQRGLDARLVGLEVAVLTATHGAHAG